mmetsp:Transcript_274/g.833  ORF Transcript_274/g.833 Transcript_274/m.833 type:complete len:303 (+) Transcript_274:370-1278(+)
MLGTQSAGPSLEAAPRVPSRAWKASTYRRASISRSRISGCARHASSKPSINRRRTPRGTTKCVSGAEAMPCSVHGVSRTSTGLDWMAPMLAPSSPRREHSIRSSLWLTIITGTMTGSAGVARLEGRPAVADSSALTTPHASARPFGSTRRTASRAASQSTKMSAPGGRDLTFFRLRAPGGAEEEPAAAAEARGASFPLRRGSFEGRDRSPSPRGAASLGYARFASFRCASFSPFSAAVAHTAVPMRSPPPGVERSADEDAKPPTSPRRRACSPPPLRRMWCSSASIRRRHSSSMARRAGPRE